MEVSIKIVIAVVVITIILLWYVNSTRSDVSRYKNIIDTYMSESTDKKKVRFKMPDKTDKVKK